MSFDKDGYQLICLSKNGKTQNLKVHRLVLEAFVEKSNLSVDHINSIKDDNRLENLRYCTVRENNTFAREKMNTTSKYVGVSICRDGRYVAQINLEGKVYWLGRYNCEKEAKEVYDKTLFNFFEFGVVPEVRQYKTSKYKYLSYGRRDGKWLITYKNKCLGRYNTEHEAYIKLLEYLEQKDL